MGNENFKVYDLGEPDFTTKSDRPGFISSSGWPIRREITKLNDNMKIMVKQMHDAGVKVLWPYNP